MMNKIPIIELFGPTIQGEGMMIGRKSIFLRTAGCDYQCAWCDSAFTWNGTEKNRIRMLDPAEILNEVQQLGGNLCNHVTITGGNPALIGVSMQPLIHLFHQHGYQLGLETQGSLMQDWLLQMDDLTLSPKPPSSHMKTNWLVLDELVTRLLDKRVHFSLKVVVFDDVDLSYAKSVFNRYPTVKEKYLQPGNAHIQDTGDIVAYLLERLEWLFSRSLKDPELNNVRVLPQLHALVWGNQRGR
ncbi:7-carboxy-7-deazaguanine synthase QueE [Alicyclobacillaceae bacterium I2511]|nr:7-carboxy-7-deazaguanine synthase QueE [Alicyclobacillaceae bacterium I2511]